MVLTVVRLTLIHSNAQIEREFAELDMDHDGFITPADLVAASKAAAESQNQGRRSFQLMRSTSPAPTLGTGEVNMAAILHDMVQEVLGAELTTAEAEEMLDEIDDEHKGKISLQEVSAPFFGSNSQ